MYSLNVPVPGRVSRLAADLRPSLAGAETVRDDHTLVCKRLGSPDAGEHHRIDQRAREALAGLPPFAVRVDGLDVFERPPLGTGPVLYLAVESPGLARAHDRLCEAFDPVEDIEGDDYVPHVTVARGGDVGRLAGREVGPVEWTVEALHFHDAAHGGRAGEVRLPA